MASLEWKRDELILALDLYLRIRPSVPSPSMSEMQELSDLLNGEAFYPQAHRPENFRSVASVVMKLMNFRSIDPAYGGKGLSASSIADRAVWEEFMDRQQELTNVASAIRHLIHNPPPAAVDNEGLEIEGEEGRLLSRLHHVRERDPRLVKAKRDAAIRLGSLLCEVCGFSFSVFYGARGADYIECHHVTPLSDLITAQKTRLVDLALLCSNCHRMIHAKRPWLTIEELRRTIAEQAKCRRIAGGIE